ncbi:MAG: hypothetical protein GEU79_17250 [Acidimicrobiia bacterium]|nr:hypothetical protein [Acidimicrobiia bacterium]
MIADVVAEEGPVPFERFMELALYGEEGFFTTGKLRSDRTGDFMTSPEVSPLFGETISVYVRALHESCGDPFMVVEAGAGSGSLIKPLLAQTGLDGMAVEVSPAAREKLGEITGLSVLSDLTDLPSRFRGVVVANELLDNLPMAMAQRIDGVWRERWVGIVDGSLELVDADARSEVVDWLDRYVGEVPDGGWVEAQLEVGEWLAKISDRLTEGAILLIDYGDTAENLLPRRADGTLRTYRAHHLGPHPLDEPGATDITADVNFTAAERIAGELGFESALWRQDDFLTALGLRDRLSLMRREELALAGKDEMERMVLRTRRTEVEALLHPRGLGDFRVLELTRAVPSPLGDHNAIL